MIKVKKRMLSVIKQFLWGSFLYETIEKIYWCWSYLRFHILNKIKNLFFPFTVSSDSVILIPLVETSHFKVTQHLIIGAALRLRGKRILVLVCDGFLGTCEIRSKALDHYVTPCWRCKFAVKNFLPFFGLETVTLSALLDGNEFNAVNEYRNLPPKIKTQIDRCVDESVVRHFYGDLTNLQEVELLKKRHSLVAMQMWFCASILERDYSVESILVYMSSYSAWEPLILYFEYKNVRAIQVSTHFYDANAQSIDVMKLYRNDERYKKFLKSVSFPRNFREQVDDFLRQRGVYEVTTGEVSIRWHLGKRKILVCPNVFYDIGMDKYPTIFESICDWVIGTVKFAQDQSDLDVIVRLHPAERNEIEKFGAKSLSSVIKEAVDVSCNVRVITSYDNVSTYYLIGGADIVVTYNGTVGLEALLLEKDVVVVSQAPYSFIKGINSPKTKEDYFNMLCSGKFLTKPCLNEVYKFAYFYFIKTAIPWNLTPSSMSGKIFEELCFTSVSDLEFGKNKGLDIICRAVLDEKFVPESVF